MFGFTALNAKPIDASQAQFVAQKFASAQLAIEHAETRLVYTGQNEALFVFNLSENAFVIIAGADAYRPVIGYSDESAFDATDIPPALEDYLNGIAENIDEGGS